MIDTLNSYDKIIQRTSNLVRTLKVYPKVFEQKEFQGLHKFFEKVLFIVLNHLDLIIGLKYLDVSQSVGNNLEANYFSRIVILTSHEILNDLNKLVGTEIRNELIEKIGIEGIKELDKTSKEMNALKKKYMKRLKELRNKVVGHKYDHSIEQAEIILNIDNREIYSIGNEIFKVQMRYIGNYTKLIEEM